MFMILKRMPLNQVIMKNLGTDDEDTEEARSEKKMRARKNLKEKIMRMWRRRWEQNEQFRRLPFTATGVYKTPS
ncbi:hypothetical protein JTB14_001640 [Gonioctena quinquepunctata]|nr:hypothetical protein JTB14_001640 [Gonioctena quinquepunctata]